MITKSDFVKHEKCPLWLWLVKARKDLLPEVTPELQRIFDFGNLIDQLVRKLYPEGVEIEGYHQQGWANTQIAIDKGATVMFQPTAITLDGLSAKADILTKDPETGLWDLREVKSSTKVKEEHFVDVAFQRICFERAGVKIGRTFLVHINNEFVRNGEIDPDTFFTAEDITEEVLEHTHSAQLQIEEAKKIAAHAKAPDGLLIQKCTDPVKCEYLEYYIHGFPEIYNIADSIPDEHLKALLDRGTLDYTKLPQELLDKVGFQPPVPFEEIDIKGIKKELGKLEYPLYFFDYETYSAGIPPFDGFHPYQQIPFQYSLHIQREKGGLLEHKEFLAREFTNPIPELLEQLKADIGPKGSVIVWYENFEMGRNIEMAKMYPEYVDFLLDLNSRMFDLMLMFKMKNQLYLHSEFGGSASLKKVLPVICPELAYDDLEIKEGGTASASWPILTAPETQKDQKAKLADDMSKYCERDTEAMVGILERLQKKIE